MMFVFRVAPGATSVLTWCAGYSPWRRESSPMFVGNSAKVSWIQPGLLLFGGVQSVSTPWQQEKGKLIFGAAASKQLMSPVDALTAIYPHLICDSS